MKTVEEIVKSMLDASPDYKKPMTIEDARIDVENLRRDARSNDEELPEELTPELYAEIYNSMI